MKIDFYSQYLQPETRHAAHPFDVWSFGWNRIPAQTDYLSFQLRHPKDRRFPANAERKLESLVIVRISKGFGHFSSSMTETLPVPANSLIIVFPGVGHKYRYDETTGWNEEWIEIDPSAALPLLAEAGIDARHPISTHASTFVLGTAFRNLFDVANRSHAQNRILMEAAAHRILAEAIDLRATNRTVDPVESKIEEARLRLEADLANPISIARLAKDVHSSPSWLREEFKRATGLSPKRYQMRVRILRAAKLLRETTLPVTEIASESGFNSLYAFSRHFAAESKLSPTAYRKRHAAHPLRRGADPSGGV